MFVVRYLESLAWRLGQHCLLDPIYLASTKMLVQPYVYPQTHEFCTLCRLDLLDLTHIALMTNI